MKNLGINELKNTLLFYNRIVPNTIYQIKKKANHIIIQQSCISNCDLNQTYKKILTILNKKRIISCQKKLKRNKTKKSYGFMIKQTRVRSPIFYFDA